MPDFTDTERLDWMLKTMNESGWDKLANRLHGGGLRRRNSRDVFASIKAELIKLSGEPILNETVIPTWRPPDYLEFDITWTPAGGIESYSVAPKVGTRVRLLCGDIERDGVISKMNPDGTFEVTLSEKRNV